MVLQETQGGSTSNDVVFIVEIRLLQNKQIQVYHGNISAVNCACFILSPVQNCPPCEAKDLLPGC